MTRPSPANASAAKLLCRSGPSLPCSSADGGGSPGQRFSSDAAVGATLVEGGGGGGCEGEDDAATRESPPVMCSSAEEWQACVGALIVKALEVDGEGDDSRNAAAAGPRMLLPLLHLSATVVPPLDLARKIAHAKPPLSTTGVRQPSGSVPSPPAPPPPASSASASPKGAATVDAQRSKGPRLLSPRSNSKGAPFLPSEPSGDCLLHSNFPLPLPTPLPFPPPLPPPTRSFPPSLPLLSFPLSLTGVRSLFARSLPSPLSHALACCPPFLRAHALRCRFFTREGLLLLLLWLLLLLLLLLPFLLLKL